MSLFWLFPGIPNGGIVSLRTAGHTDPHLPHVLPLEEQEVTCSTRDATVGSRTLNTFFGTTVVAVIAGDSGFDLSEGRLDPTEVRVEGVVLHRR